MSRALLSSISQFQRLSSRSFSTTLRPLSDKLTVCTQKDGVRKITLANPKKRNALSMAMMDQLLTDLSKDVNDSLRVIVIKAEGPVFSAGHDLRELSKEQGSEKHSDVFSRCTDVMTLVQDLPIPVIAQVNGLATAAGCQLVASCDIAIATGTSRFATPGVNVGLFCSTPAVAVGRAVPRKVALEMLFTGHPISAQDALMHGLISRIVPEDKLDEEVDKLASRICETSREVTEVGKACFYRQIVMGRDPAYKLAGQTMVDNLQLGDGKEGIDAFIQKRKPKWGSNL